jgi:DNA mismatch endonuclease, patch repair protein
MKREGRLISRIMASIPSKNTGPELQLATLLLPLRRSYQLHPPEVLGHPDLIFPKQRLAIFVDGDFWHGRQWQLRGFRSLEEQFKGSQNAKYWISKISNNISRDGRNRRRLRRTGWHVMRIWENDLKSDADKCLRRIMRMIEKLDQP